MKSIAAIAAAALVLLGATNAEADDGQKIPVKNRQMIVAITGDRLEQEIVGKPLIIQKPKVAYALGMTRSLDRACHVLNATDGARLEKLEQTLRRTDKVADELDAALQVMVVAELDNGAFDTTALLGRYDCADLRRLGLTGPLLAFWAKHLTN